MHYTVVELGKLAAVPSVGGSNQVTSDALQLVDVLYIRSPNWLFGLSAILVALIIFICIPYVRSRKEVQDA